MPVNRIGISCVLLVKWQRCLVADDDAWLVDLEVASGLDEDGFLEDFEDELMPSDQHRGGMRAGTCCMSMLRLFPAPSQRMTHLSHLP